MTTMTAVTQKAVTEMAQRYVRLVEDIKGFTHSKSSYHQPPPKKKKGIRSLFNKGKTDRQVSNGDLTQDKANLLVEQPSPPMKNKKNPSTQLPSGLTQEPSTSSQQPSGSLHKASVIEISEDEDSDNDGGNNVEADEVPEKPEESEEDELSQFFISFTKQMLNYFTRTAYERMDCTYLCIFPSSSNNWV